MKNFKIQFIENQLTQTHVNVHHQLQIQAVAANSYHLYQIKAVINLPYIRKTTIYRSPLFEESRFQQKK